MMTRYINLSMSAKRMWMEAIDIYDKTHPESAGSFGVGAAIQDNSTVVNKYFGLYSKTAVTRLDFLMLQACLPKTKTYAKLNQKISICTSGRSLLVKVKNINNRDILAMLDMLDVDGNCGILDETDTDTLVYNIPINLITVFTSTETFVNNGIEVLYV